jgi:hypothetical protein
MIFAVSLSAGGGFFYLLFLILQGKFKIRKIKVSQEKMSS